MYGLWQYKIIKNNFNCKSPFIFRTIYDILLTKLIFERKRKCKRPLQQGGYI